MTLSSSCRLLLVVAFAVHICAAIEPTFENLDFASGFPGIQPPGWLFGWDRANLYAAKTATNASCAQGKKCGLVQSIGDQIPFSGSFLHQVVDATPMRGKVLIFRAKVRVEGPPATEARLLIQVHRRDGSTSAREDMGTSPVRSGGWSIYEISAPVAMEATDVELGMQFHGRGSAWIDNISVIAVLPTTTEALVTNLIDRFAAARNAHDGPAAGNTYWDDGEYLWQDGQTTRGRAALSDLWGRVLGTAQRRIFSFEPVTERMAIVRVVAEFHDPPAAPLRETFFVTKDSGTWKIRLHEADWFVPPY